MGEALPPERDSYVTSHAEGARLCPAVSHRGEKEPPSTYQHIGAKGKSRDEKADGIRGKVAHRQAQPGETESQRHRDGHCYTWTARHVLGNSRGRYQQR